MPNREEIVEGEATGKQLVIAWFDKVPFSNEHLRPRDEQVRPKLLSVVEVFLAVGHVVPANAKADLTEAQREALVEESFAAATLRRLEATRETAAEGLRTYLIVASENAEEAWLHGQNHESLSKMALARILEIHAGGNRKVDWQALNLAQLRDRAAAWLPPLPPASKRPRPLDAA